ncbi:MAG: hypothetical protein R3C71_11125 [Candidatus Krumholzibacteriia bacterium]|nr:hypothetical protein [bacterium]
MSRDPRLLAGLPRSAWAGFALLVLAAAVAVARTLLQPALERPLYHLAGALILAGLFGPGLLREFGLLRDQDEFQRRVAQRAGWRAFLAGGLVLLLLAHFMPWPQPPAFGRELPKLPLNAALLVMLLTYVCSTLQDYWGARRGATAILLALAALFALGAILDEAPDWLGVLVDLRFSAGLLLALLVGRRYPQVAGALLLVLALLTLLNLRTAEPSLRLSWGALLLTPPIITGAALLREGGSE